MVSTITSGPRGRGSVVGLVRGGDGSLGVAAKIVLIGSTGGLFSGLLGVGGGVVMVPLLILVLGYKPSVATGTSLVAIVLIASVGTVTHIGYGNVQYRDGLLIGIPALAGVLFGTWVQQKIPGDSLSLAFCGVLTVTALWLLIR
jgi:uncharacterized membrane protein YfcA